jgi:hypothetical protein
MASLQESFAASFETFKTKTEQPKSKFTSYFTSSNDNLEAGDSSSLLGLFRTRASETFNNLTTSHPDSECFGISTMQRYTLFILMVLSSFLFLMISLFSLPMVLINPGKFALSYTLASLLFVTSYSVLNGWRAHLKHLFCWERVWFTSVYFTSLFGTLWFSVVTPVYILTILFTIAQVGALIWYLASYLPGGTQGLSYFARNTIGLPV